MIAPLDTPTCPECKQPLARNLALRRVECLTPGCAVNLGGPQGEGIIEERMVEKR